MSFDVPDHIRPLRARVRRFIEERIYPVEQVLDRGDGEARAVLRELMVAGQGRRRSGRSGTRRRSAAAACRSSTTCTSTRWSAAREHAMVALGTHSLQDSIMLNLYASPEWRDRYLAPLVAGEVFPSFAMTEPDVASSDPTQLQTRAVLDGDHWVITGRKWFTTGARNAAAYTTVMVRTEPDAPPHRAFSMIVVPTDTPGYDIVRETPVLGMHGRPLRGGVRRRARAAQQPARRARPGLPDRPAAARSGPHLPLHALARPGAARLRSDVRARQHAASRSARRWPRSSRSRT